MSDPRRTSSWCGIGLGSGNPVCDYGPDEPCDVCLLVADCQKLQDALAAYRSALRSGEPESARLRELGDAALAADAGPEPSQEPTAPPKRGTTRTRAVAVLNEDAERPEEDEDELESVKEADGLTHGQARYLVRKLQRSRARSAYTVRCPDDTYAVYSYPALMPETTKGDGDE